MNTQKVNIINNSSQKDIYVFLKSPEDANVPEKFSSSIKILPNTVSSIGYQNATANMFVFDESRVVLWQGIIPTKVQKPIEIYPEERKVMFDSIQLPDNFKVTTSLSNSSSGENKNGSWLIYFLVALVIVLIILGVFLLSGKLKIKK